MCRWLARIVSGRRLATSLAALVGGGRQAQRKARWPPTPARHMCPSGLLCVRERVRVHGYAALHVRGRWAAWRCPAPLPLHLPRPGPRHVPPLSGGRCPLSWTLGSRRRPSAPDPAQYLMRLHAHCLSFSFSREDNSFQSIFKNRLSL